MSDELTRLLDARAVARLSMSEGELALLTMTHESADRVVIERRKLGSSIDLGDLLQLIGAHGLAELPTSQIQVSELQPAQLPAPIEAPLPTTRRTTRHHTPPIVPVSESEMQAATVPTHACPQCTRMFISGRSLGIHLAITHKTETPKQLEARAKAQATIDRVSCPQCEKDFDPRGLGPHMAKVHKAAPVPEPEPPVATETYACSQCDRTFRTQKSLDQHVSMMHWETETAAPVVQTDGICDVCRRPEGLHDRCVDCGMLLGDEHTAGPVHIRINGKPLCANCDAYRTTASRLVRTS